MSSRADDIRPPRDPFTHEQVAFCHDPDTGLRAIIALYSTALGPGLGGTRFYPYASADDALADVLDLSRGMTYKNAVAGLDHGGGKAVIIGDPAATRRPSCCAHTGGSWRASAAATSPPPTSAPTSPTWTSSRRPPASRPAGREAHGGAGDSSVLTAYGVFQGMRAAAAAPVGHAVPGRPAGRDLGVGKVGRRLVEPAAADGASVVICDVSPDAVAAVLAEHPSVEVAADAATLTGLPLDVYSPNAMGGALDDDTVERLQAEIVCGAANNQLAVEGPAGRRTGWRSAGSSTPRTSWSTAAA